MLGVPLILMKRSSIVLQMIIQFLIAVGVSALACDSLFHLWPEVRNTRVNAEGDF